MSSLLIRGSTIVRSTGLERVEILIRDNVIVCVAPDLEATRPNGQAGRASYPSERPGRAGKLQASSAEEVIDASQKLLFPGLIDCHVHFREPGLTHKGDMRSESRAALAGGVTTVCDMPNTIPPTVTVEAFAEKTRIAHKIRDCDIRFFFGVTEKKHLIALRNIWIKSDTELRRLRKYCPGVKVYLDHSTGNQKASADVLEETFQLCGELGIPLVAHCEDAETNRVESGKWKVESGNVALHSKMRPPESEARSIDFAIGLARKHNTKLHVAHLSTKQGLELVRQAKKSSIAVTCEVAPHHLFLSVDDCETLGTLGKMNPPLRSAEHQAALWEGISDGTVDCIATDHAPHTLEEKTGVEIHESPLRAPSGVPGVETMLPLLLSVVSGKVKLSAVSCQLSASDVLRLCFENPNRIFSLGKQGIVEGAKADIVIVDPTKEWTIRGSELKSKCGWTPYEGWRVQGAVEKIIRP